MIKLKTAEELIKLRVAGRRLAEILKAVERAVVPGVTTAALDELARELVEEKGDRPSFLNYRPRGARQPFPASLCVSINDEVVHGIPSAARVVAPGDLVSIDLGLCHEERFFVDAALTVLVPPVDQGRGRLAAATREALAAAVAAARPGARIGAIGAAVEAVAKRYGYGSVQELGGHGVGFAVHEDPDVPNAARPTDGPVISPGLVIAIEPMFTSGRADIVVADDGYTVKTRDGSLAAHFEHTIAITETGPEILTKLK